MMRMITRRPTKARTTQEGVVMLNQSEREHIRRVYYLQKKSIRRIAQEEGYSRDAVERAIINAPRLAYRLSRLCPAPRPGPYHTRIAALLEQDKHLSPKQRYTTPENLNRHLLERCLKTV